MFQKIFGAILIIIGPILIIKTDIFYRMVGKIGWAENKLGSGGTILLINIIGLILIFVGLTMVLGFFDGIIGFVFDPILRTQ